MRNYETKIAAIVALYHPNKVDLDNICNYIDSCDFCILMDDSEIDNESQIVSFFKQKNIDNYSYHWNKKNIGLCASVNIGIKIARANNASWILLMNGDSKISNSVIKIFKNFIEAHDTNKVSCIAPQYDYDRHPRKPYKGIKEITWANMSGMCVNYSVLERIGLFDEKLFIDGLDMEWGIRAKQAGYKMYEIGNAVMHHHPAETKKIKIFGKILFMYGWASPTRYYYQFRANHYILHKYKSFEAFKWQFIKFMKVLLLFNDRKEYLKMYKKAIKDYKNGNWGKYQGE